MDNRAIYTSLQTGKRIYLRPIRPHDSPRIRAGIAQMSDKSRYFRFFSGMRQVPDAVVQKLVAVDGVDHLAWGALDVSEHDLPAIGAVRVVREHGADTGELAIATLDAFHHSGLSRILLATIVCDCQRAGIRQLEADVLSENRNARRLFKALGGKCVHSEGAFMKYAFDVDQMDAALQAMDAPEGLGDVYTAFERFDRGQRRVAC